MNSCKELEYTPIQYAWDKHCGGSYPQFVRRVVRIGDSVLLGRIGWMTAKPMRLIGITWGSTLMTKAGNDFYEAWTGKPSPMRKTLGDGAYELIGFAALAYAIMHQVQRINYLGNPVRDLFYPDPLSKVSAYKQFTTLEAVDAAFGVMDAVEESTIVSGWIEHIERNHIDY